MRNLISAIIDRINTWSGKTFLHNVLVTATFVITAAFGFIISLHYGLDQYPGYDASPMVNLADRILHYQRAPSEFFLPFPPLFSMGAWGAFFLFGEYWRSLCVMGALFYTLSSCVFFVFVYKYLEDFILSFVLTLVFYLSTAITYGFWWHTPISSIIAAISIFLVITYKGEPVTRVMILITLVLLAFSKPNFALFILPIGYIFCIKSHNKIRDVVHLILVFSVAWCLLSRLSGQSILDYARSIMGIIPKRSMVISSIFNEPFLPGLFPCIFTSCIVFFSNKTTYLNLINRYKLLLTLFLVIYVYCLISNNDMYEASIPIFLSFIAISIKYTECDKKLLVTPLVIAALFIAINGITRERVRLAGPYLFWEPSGNSVMVRDGFFKDSVIGENLFNFNMDFVHIIENYKSEKVFFGPRVEFGYAAFHLPPPVNTPLWFDRKEAWPINGESSVLRSFVKNKFDLLIFYRGDVTDFSYNMISYINHNYHKEGDYKYALLLVKNDFSKIKN